MIDITGALHNTNLQRADRIAMAFGLEARVPFLDVKSVAVLATCSIRPSFSKSWQEFRQPIDLSCSPPCL